MRFSKFLWLLIILPELAWSQLYVGPAFGLKGSTVTFFEKRNKEEFRGAPGLGFDAGIMVMRRMKEKYSLHAQLLYSQKTKVVYGEAPTAPNFRSRTVNQYIELPITYTIEFKRLVGETQAGMTKSFNWFLGAGPTVSYWMGGKGNLRSDNLIEELRFEGMDYKVAFGVDSATLNSQFNLLNIKRANRLQFSVNFTGGVIVEPVGFQKVIITTSLELGQSFMAKNNTGYFTGSPVDFEPMRTKFHSVRFSVAYVLDMKLEGRQRGKSTIKNKSAANVRKKKKR